MPITESSVTLNFPDNNYFRLCDCDGYKSIQNNFAEMDACWYDKASDILYIIELKNWGNNNLAEESDSNYTSEQIKGMKEGISNYRIRNLLKKSVIQLVCLCQFCLERQMEIEYNNVLHLRFQIIQQSNFYQLSTALILIALIFQL